MTFQEALQLYDTKQYEEAVNAFLELLNQHDNDLSIASCFYLSKCYYSLKDEKNRLYYLMNSFIYGYGVAEIYCELGFYYMDLKEYHKAISFFEAARLSQREHLNIMFLPDYWGYFPCLQLSICYYHIKDIRQAIYYNKLAGNYEPNSHSVQHNQVFYQTLLNQTELTNELSKQHVLEQRKKYQDYDHPGVSLITVTNKSKYIATIFENYDRMTYPKKELIIILNDNDLNSEDYLNYARVREHIQVYQLDASVSLGECLNYGVSHSKYDYIAKIDDDDFYGEHYLIDQMNCFWVPDVCVVTKSIRFMLFERDNSLFIFHGHGENKEVIGGGGGTIIAKKSLFDTIRFHDVNCAEDHYLFYDCSLHGYKIYASDRFNYVYKRHPSLKDHTFIISDLELKRSGDEFIIKDDFTSITTV